MKLTREDLYKMISESVSVAMKDRVEAAAETAEKNDRDAKQGIKAPEFVASGRMRQLPEREQKQARVGLFVKSILSGGRYTTKDQAIAFARKSSGGALDPRVEKALAESTLGAGGALVETEMSAEIIELLSARSVVRKRNVPVVPLVSGHMSMPYIASGATASYTGEAVAQNATTATFGQLELRSKKLIALIPISNSLMRHASQRSDVIVGQELSRSMGLAEDAAFIRGTGSAASPKGMLHWAASANKFNITHASAVATAAEAGADLGKAIYLLEDGDVNIENGGWLIAPRIKKALMNARDANSNLVFQPEMVSGTLFGFPFDFTTSIPRNLDTSGAGTGDESEVYFADFSKLIIGESEQLQLELFDQASYVDASGTLVSAVSLDQTVVRAISEHDFGARQRGAEIAVIQSVDWDTLA